MPQSANEPVLVSPDGEFSEEEVRKQLNKVSASELFANSERMKRFLNIVVEYSLAGRATELKEYLIGIEVFDRNKSFDPRLDPIVRVEARRLRSKLNKYYESAGWEDELVIEFPKGTYVPVFRSRRISKKTGHQPNSIAVLPFRNFGPEPDNDYFSDGLAEELIHLLTRVPGLQVVSWRSSAQLKSHQDDLAHIREQLNVETILSGSVRRAGDQLRIAVQLIATSDGRYLWSDVYERKRHDIFAIEEEIARSIVNTLRRTLGLPSSQQVTRSKVSNAESHNLCLLGRYHSKRRTPEGLYKSIDCFRKAIALEQENAEAHAGLADTYCLLADYGVMYPSGCVPPAKAAAQRALEIDPMLGEAHASLAQIRSLYDWEWEDAERLYLRAIELNPGYAAAHHWFGTDHLALLGRIDDGFEQIDIACRLDPLSANALEGKGYLCLLSRRYEEAAHWHRQCLELDPFFYKSLNSIGRVLIQQEKYPEAIETLRKAQSFGGTVPNLMGALGQAYALSGLETEARQTLAELDELSKQRYVQASCFAVIHIGLGETDAALTWLETGVERRDLNLGPIKMHPAYDSLRSEPRFQALLRRINLSK
jgi:TolB-like protein